MVEWKYIFTFCQECHCKGNSQFSSTLVGRRALLSLLTVVDAAAAAAAAVIVIHGRIELPLLGNTGKSSLICFPRGQVRQ